jgi:hypothetical protein
MGGSRHVALQASVTEEEKSPQQQQPPPPPPQFDPEYYTPPDQSTRTDNSQTTTRITLTRFLSNAVKDNPEVSFSFISLLVPT